MSKNTQNPPTSDPRTQPALDATRGMREMTNREHVDSPETSDEARLEQFRLGLYNNALPNLPTIPGWHVCYLTTTNPRDTIEARLALGYELLRPSDFPGGAMVPSIRGGQWDGFVGFNEMIAAKIPERLYQMYMREAHFHQPNKEDEKLVANVEQIKGQMMQLGSKVQVGDGIESLKERARTARISREPTFE